MRTTLPAAGRAVLAAALLALGAAGAQEPATRAAELTLEQANAIVAGAIARARERNFRPLTVVVLDASGELKAMQREDGASMFRFDIAVGKAYAAVGMGASSRYLAERARENPNFFVALAATADGKFLPQTGAVLILNADGRVLGAAGASGAAGAEDEEAVLHGIRSAGFSTDIED